MKIVKVFALCSIVVAIIIGILGSIGANSKCEKLYTNGKSDTIEFSRECHIDISHR